MSSGDEAGDPKITEKEYHELKQSEDPVTSAFKLGPQNGQTFNTVHKHNYIPFWQLNCLMVMVVLSASGLVSPQDFAFVVFSIIYLFFLSKFAFPKLTDPMEEPPVFNPESYLVRLGPLFGGIIGIVIPIAYIFEGFIEGDKEGIRAAAPHVFLLASQVFMDGVAFSDRFSIPIRVFVPVFYNAKRIFTLVDWVKREFSKAGDQEYGGSASERRLFLGRVLAVVNLVFWSYDLFFFMLPVYLPRAFRKYYAAAKSD
ncbi:PREDICTED: uncharacterized protein LOC101311634 [Fragaria vesca subsp. vesca]|uniref:uncharacterized protein LOC101311634 n=1 Tax=Fragaria vesca subsp. vesca TaxID=101020 RepID=UPI0002C30F46|nr:PREDICTED: uncharacterized protein LOC101311634 [Fragaria vesca subsp. vesca]